MQGFDLATNHMYDIVTGLANKLVWAIYPDKDLLVFRIRYDLL